MRIETSIADTYCPHMGIWEGLREKGQNGLDAEKEFNAPFSMTWRNNKIYFVNEGVSLPYEALLMGHSTKQDRADLIGQHGEGLKIGALALVRAGMDVKIRSGSEVWLPKIERSERYKANVLVFHIHKGRKDNNRVQVEVSGVDKEDWEKIQPNFLFLNKDLQEAKGGYQGSVLLNPELKGKIFVKGIFVQHLPDYEYGYNLLDASLDRDRRILDSYDLKWRLKSLWTSAVRGNNELTKKFIPLLSEGKEEVKGFEEAGYLNLDTEVIDEVAASFTEEYGEEAFPVSNIGESEKLDHFGKKGIIVPQTLKAVLESKFGTFETVSHELKKQPQKSYGWHELSEQEQENFSYAVNLLNPYMDDLKTHIDIVDFADNGLMGTYSASEKKIKLAHKLLKDRIETLKTLLHEVAHQWGGDGNKDHVSRIEEIWSELFRNLSSS